MIYLMFSDKILINDGHSMKTIEKPVELKDKLGVNGQEVRLCCVDVDVLIASSTETHEQRRDSLLAHQFMEVYTHEYITLNEKIGDNLFQVIGIKEKKVENIYALMPNVKVDAFVPYAIAIRSLFEVRGIKREGLMIVVDILGSENLITVFEGLKFSRTRTIEGDTLEQILPDIKRSLMDFQKKLGDLAIKSTSDVAVFINDQQMAKELSALEPSFVIEFLDCSYPSLEGLKCVDTQIKYKNHGQIIRERQKKELHLRFIYIIVSLSICLAATVFWGYSHFAYSFMAHDFKLVSMKNSHLKQELDGVDKRIYRDDLKRLKYLNYANVFLEVSAALPSTYSIESFKFLSHEGRWDFDTYIFAQDDQFYDDIPRDRFMKSAAIKNCFIKNRPGKYLKIVL